MNFLLKFINHRKQKVNSIFSRCLKVEVTHIKLQIQYLWPQQNRFHRSKQSLHFKQSNQRRTYLQAWLNSLNQYQKILSQASISKSLKILFELNLLLKHDHSLCLMKIYSHHSNLRLKIKIQWACFQTSILHLNLPRILVDLDFHLLNLKNNQIHLLRWFHNPYLNKQSRSHLLILFNKVWTLGQDSPSTLQQYLKNSKTCSLKVSIFNQLPPKTHLQSF